MKYAKPALLYDDQADLLLSRGMVGDREKIISALQSVSYYRLSGYWHPFRYDETGALLPDSEFRPGTAFNEIWNRYAFDRRLRVLVMDGIERVEIAFRSWLAYEHAHAHGAFAYANDASSLSGLLPHDRHRLLDELTKEFANSKETFVKHFVSQYRDQHAFMPIWMASETMTLGQSVWFFRGVSSSIKQSIAKRLSVHDKVLWSWLKQINAARNICAHHGRLWNRGFGLKILTPRHLPKWSSPVRIDSDQMFGVLTVLKYCLRKIAPQSGWPQRFTALLDEYPSVPLRFMGFPNHWAESPLWK